MSKELLLEPAADQVKSLKETLPALGSTKFNFLLLKRLYRILRILFPSLFSRTLGFFALFMFIRASAEYNYYNTGLIPSKFYGSLTSRDNAVFKESLYQSLVIVVSACICKSAVELLANILYVRWRGLLTCRLQSLYFSNLNYYKLNVINRIVDNPDQRITQDVDKFCDDLGTQLLPKLVLWPFIVVYYTYRTYMTVGFVGVLSIYGLFFVATVVNKFLMGPVISLVVTQEKREGDFRFHHAKVRTDAESIAFYDGGSMEGVKAKQFIGRLLYTQLGVAHWTFPLNFSVNLFDYLSSIVTYVVLGVIIFSGGYDHLSSSDLASRISEVSFFSLYLLNNFSTLVDQSNNVADLAGYAHRIGHLLEVLNNLSKRQSTAVSDNLSSSEDDDDDKELVKKRHSIIEPDPLVAVIFENVTISPPGANSKTLVEGLTFELQRGKNILIVGPSGSGKSSILRVLKQLWTPVKGQAYITLVEEDSEVMFIPQKPHLTTGSLADQIAYPWQHKEENVSMSVDLESVLTQSRMNEALQLTDLIALKERLGGVDVIYDGDWDDYVSPGEKQKIAFARLFYHKPSFAILDEATSSLSEEDEHRFYTTVCQMGTTVLSIGHRSTIKQYHQLVLAVTGQGQWTLGVLE